MAQYNYGDNRPQPGKWARIAFGILMICVYLGMGLLFIFSVFTSQPVLNYIVGGLLIAYGIWRGYRLYKGLN